MSTLPVVRYFAHTHTLIPQHGPFVCLCLSSSTNHAVTPSEKASTHQKHTTTTRCQLSQKSRDIELKTEIREKGRPTPLPRDNLLLYIPDHGLASSGTLAHPGLTDPFMHLVQGKNPDQPVFFPATAKRWFPPGLWIPAQYRVPHKGLEVIYNVLCGPGVPR